MKFTEGGFRDWGYTLAQDEFGATELDGGPWCTLTNPNTGNTIVIKDVIADAMLQQIITRPAEYSVLTTMNLNGDYISDALAAQVGGIGIAQEPTSTTTRASPSRSHPRHGPQVRRTRQGQPRFPHPLGRDDAAPHGLEGSRRPHRQRHGRRHLEQDGDLRLERLMDDATLLSCSAFGAAMIQHM